MTLARSLQASTNDKGVDIILEMLANVNLEADLEMAAVNGKVIVSFQKLVA